MGEKAPSEARGTEDGSGGADLGRGRVNTPGGGGEEAVGADPRRRPSVLGKLKEVQERIAAGQQKIVKNERKLEPQL